MVVVVAVVAVVAVVEVGLQVEPHSCDCSCGGDMVMGLVIGCADVF